MSDTDKTPYIVQCRDHRGEWWDVTTTVSASDAHAEARQVLADCGRPVRVVAVLMQAGAR